MDHLEPHTFLSSGPARRHDGSSFAVDRIPPQCGPGQRKTHRRSRPARTVHGLRTTASEPDRWADAVKHLRRVDPQLREVIKRIGPCRLAPRPDRFGTLVNSIVAQQISSKAAASINLRLHALGGQPHQPARLIGPGRDRPCRSVGLSAPRPATC